MHNIWKRRQGLKVTQQRLCYQARMIKKNGWLTELEMNVIKKSTVNENADKNDENIGNNDNDDQSGATENKCENLVNVLQNLQNNVSLSFENVEWMSEEENIIIKKKIEIAEHDLDEKANGFNPIQDDGGGRWQKCPLPVFSL